jgi:hypothetical protein
MGGGWMVAQEQQRDAGANDTATQAKAADAQASTETRRNSSQ